MGTRLISFEELAGNRVFSIPTSLQYEKDVARFLEYCAVKRIDPGTVTLLGLRGYLAYLRNREFSLTSIAKKLSAIRYYYRCLMDMGEIGENPAELLSVRFQKKTRAVHLSDREMMTLMEMPRMGTGVGLRDRAILELWYVTGARASQIVAILENDFDWKKSEVCIFRKNGALRVPLHSRLINVLANYRDVRNKWLSDAKRKENSFFINAAGKPLTRVHVWKIVKRYAKQANFTKNVSPKVIRHSFANRLLRRGADIATVKTLLGHQSILTTSIYTEPNNENLRLVQLKYHPRG